MWICYTCHFKLNKGLLLPECSVNRLRVDPILPELACLNSLDQHLIKLHIPFMKNVVRMESMISDVFQPTVYRQVICYHVQIWKGPCCGLI